MWTFLLSTWFGCGSGLSPCACPPGVVGHAVEYDGACSCLARPDDLASPPAEATVFHVRAEASGGTGAEDAPWSIPDWGAIDAALAAGDVVVRFDPRDVWPDRIAVHRTDEGPNRVWLLGSDGTRRARVPGVHTGFDPVPRHRVTVRGFEITRSRDKGVFWVGGDDVHIEDNVLHDNRGSPVINLDYSSRSGFVSRDFRVVGNHVYDQAGECIYIGGAEGEDQDSHDGLVISYNLVHGCRGALSSQHDGINVKDRIQGVVVQRNVVIDADWGIEVGSAGLYEGNLTVDAGREGFHVSDGFQALPDDMLFRNNVSIRSGDDGFQLTADRAPTGDIVIEGLTVLDSGAVGFAVGGSFAVNATLRDVAVQGSPVAFDGWGIGDITMGRCATRDNGADFDRLFEGTDACDEAPVVPDRPLAGDDGLFFTDDDPWVSAGGASL